MKWMPPHASAAIADNGLADLIVKEIERLRDSDYAGARRAECLRLETIATKARDLEALGEIILSLVVPGVELRRDDARRSFQNSRRRYIPNSRSI